MNVDVYEVWFPTKFNIKFCFAHVSFCYSNCVLCSNCHSKILFCFPNSILFWIVFAKFSSVAQIPFYFEMAICLNYILLQRGESLKFNSVSRSILFVSLGPSLPRPREEGLATSACSFEKWRLTGPTWARPAPKQGKRFWERGWPIYIINSVDKTKFSCTTLLPTQYYSFFRN